MGGYIVAINGFDGQEIWRSEKFNHDVARRGLVFWEDKNSKKERIFFNNGSKLVALNTKSGLKDKSFGKNGIIKTGYSKITPSIYKENIIIASWIRLSKSTC